jgi:surface antigen
MTPKPLDAALLALAFFLGACESHSPSKEDIGMATGAVLGGVIGHQFGSGGGQTVATIGGAALGAFLGSRIGRKMDQDDQKKTAQALETSREDSATTWRNPDTGQTYSVTPTHTYQGAAGPCRHFRTVTQIDGHEEVVQGTACRQPDGTWKAA